MTLNPILLSHSYLIPETNHGADNGMKDYRSDGTSEGHPRATRKSSVGAPKSPSSQRPRGNSGLLSTRTQGVGRVKRWGRGLGYGGVFGVHPHPCYDTMKRSAHQAADRNIALAI